MNLIAWWITLWAVYSHVSSWTLFARTEFALTLTLEKVYLTLILSSFISLKKQTEWKSSGLRINDPVCLSRMTVEANTLWCVKRDLLRVSVWHWSSPKQAQITLQRRISYIRNARYSVSSINTLKVSDYYLCTGICKVAISLCSRRYTWLHTVVCQCHPLVIPVVKIRELFKNNLRYCRKKLIFGNPCPRSLPSFDDV